MSLTEAQKRQAEKNRQYWADREEEALEKRRKTEAEYDKEIQRIYSDMLAECQTQINAFYGKYADKEGITLAEAKKRVKKADIAEFERKAARYVKDKDFSAKANEEMRLYNTMMKINRFEMLKANIGLEMIAGHNELEKFMSGILKGRTEEELARQAGILGKTIRNNAQLAHAIPNASFHNATFSDRIWAYQDIMKADLEKLLTSGLIQGKNPRQLAKSLEKYVMGDAKGGAKYNAERLMRTELARVQTEAQKQSFIRNGFDKYIFIVNAGCCGHCEEVADKDSGYGKGVYLVRDMQPGLNAPPLHPQDRCSTAAYSDRKEYDEWLDFLEKGGTTAEYEKMKAKGAKIPTTPKKAEKQPQATADGFTPAKSIQEVNERLKTATGSNAAFGGMDLQLANEYLQGFEVFYRQYPKLKGFVQSVHTKVPNGLTGAYSQQSTYTKTFKHKVINSVSLTSQYKTDDFHKVIESSIKKGFHFKGTSPSTLAVHECTHALDRMIGNIQRGYVQNGSFVELDGTISANAYNQSIASEILDRVRAERYDEWLTGYFDDVSYLGDYAMTSDPEMLAQCIAYECSGQSHPFSKAVKDLFDEAYKGAFE